MIQLRQLSKRFEKTFVVENINVKIPEGEIVGLLGPNGAGKTTTLRMIAGVLPPSRGKVEINGQDMGQNDQELKKLIGFLPENNPLYDELTVEEHLKFWARVKNISGEKQHEALSFVIKHTGITEVLYRPISVLSKGYRQRVGLSQAILARTPILLLDEPTEGLDPNQRREIQALIQSLGKKRTVIISSHVLSEITRICTRVIIIHKGRIVADDTPDHLTHKKGGRQTLSAEIKGTRVLTVLKNIKGITQVTEEQPRHFTIETEKGKDVREEIFKAAVSHKWTLLSVSQRETALEDVFSELTKG